MDEPIGDLIWSDEFDAPAGTPPDPSRWRHETGSHGWGNGELQAYTDALENAVHDGEGNLVIRALRLQSGFTSARLNTQGLAQFTHGRLECRALLPEGWGMWSAFWALGADIEAVPWPGCGEIDVMENVGREPHRVFGTVHCPGHSGANGISGDVMANASLHQHFHVFAVDWFPERIIWRLDGQAYHAVAKAQLGEAWRFDHAFYLLLNLAVGGTLGADVDPQTRFPAEFKVDYVRVFGMR
jgi:beta-glucanase (GH16 family)